MIDKLKTNILTFIFEDPSPTWKEFEENKDFSEDWNLSEDYANYSYDAIIEIVDEKVYEFNSHLEALGTNLNDLTLEKSLDMEM